MNAYMTTWNDIPTMVLAAGSRGLRIAWLAAVKCAIAFSASAGQCTAIADTDWASAATWSCGRAPAAGDTLTIPANRNVKVTTNITYSGAPLRIRVLGTLSFIGGGSKLTFPCGSILEIFPPSGLVTGNSSANSQTIRICSVTVWAVGTNNNATGYTAWPVNSTLPVELVHFDATALGGGDVKLDWATASELNSARFLVLRSKDMEAFEELYEVVAAGSSMSLRTYGLTDRPDDTGHWYYRLVQEDLDGTRYDLGVRSAQVEGVAGLQCYPVPADGNLVIETPASAGLLEVFGSDGPMALRVPVHARRTELDTSVLPNGIYLVRWSDGVRTMVQRIVVAH